MVERSGDLRLEPFESLRTTDAGEVSASELRRRLGAAVDSHLAAEVPLGASLSGGLDSSFLVGLMAERLGAGVKTFAIGSPGDQDERPFARIVAERFRTDHCEITVGADDLWPRLPQVIWQGEEPRSGPLVPNSLLFARAAGEVRVLLLGEGADELFGGYLRFKTALPPLGYLPARIGAGPLRHAQAGGGARSHCSGSRSRAGAEGPARHVPRAGARPARRAAAGRPARLRAPRPAPQRPPAAGRPALDGDARGRRPFLDAGVVSLSGGCHSPPRWDGATRRWSCARRRAACCRREILGRRKQGQTNPLRLWEAAGLLDHAADLLSAPAVRARGLFQPAAVTVCSPVCGAGGAPPSTATACTSWC